MTRPTISNSEDALTSFAHILQLMQQLRAPGGCPWDQKQTLATLQPHLLEEVHEVFHALEQDNVQAHCEELGDVLLQVIFQALLRAEKQQFTMADVCQQLAHKLISRHPHVFGDQPVATSVEESLAHWEASKRQEQKDKMRGLLGDIPPSLPALQRAQKLGDKVAQVGFDWPTLSGVQEKLQEELNEMHQALSQGDVTHIQHELGDVLFMLTRLASKLHIDAEHCLQQANRRFTHRFNHIEQQANLTHTSLEDTSLAQMNLWWNEAKQKEQSDKL